MHTKAESLAHRIHADPALREVIKLVGYRGAPIPISDDDYKRLLEKYGKERFL